MKKRKTLKKPKPRKGHIDVPRYTLLEIWWMDAFGASGWEDEEAAPAPPVIKSVGYLIRSTEHGIILASGIPEKLGGQMLAPSFIPHGMVAKIRRLK